MAGIKISALPAVLAAQTTDIFPVVQAGVTSKESVAQLITLLNTSLTGFVPISGGTMTGPLILSQDPTLPLMAATKEYVDTVASGFTVILACLVATTANLNAIYNNGAAGIGATLTNNGAMVALSIDGVALALTNRVLVKDQTTTFQNGVYEVTDAGSGATNWILTRTTDYDEAPSEIHPGTLVAINSGTVNAKTSWLETATVTNIGTDPILFSQFSFGPSSFLLKANNLSDVNNVATSRTNLGLGTVATKAASDGTKTTAAMISGAVTINHMAVFADVNGTIKDGGVQTNGTVTSIATAGLATGGPITTTGTVTVTAAVKVDQTTGTSITKAVVPGVQQFHKSSVKAWINFNGSTPANLNSYNVSSFVRNSTGNYTIGFTTAFTSGNYSITATHSANGGNTSCTVILLPPTTTASTIFTEAGGVATNPAYVCVTFSGLQ